MDGVGFEVIAKAEIAKHFKKCMVTGSIANIFQIVVFAAGAYATLGTGGALVGSDVAAEKNVFELHHTSVGEQ